MADTFLLDEMEHWRGVCWCSIDKCPKCFKGLLHGQGGYGFYHRECDNCGHPDGPSLWVNPLLWEDKHGCRSRRAEEVA